MLPAIGAQTVTFIHDAPCSPSATVVDTPFPVTPTASLA
jgi:hypothetical protein